MSETNTQRIAATRLVIVGGGYTGAVLAMNAARIGTQAIDITIVEPAADLGRGIAYGTVDPSHRINVPSDRMNLFKAEPGQATRWLHQERVLPDPGSDAGNGTFYVRREAYGSFVADTLRRTIAVAGERVTFRHRHALARSLARRDGAWTVGLADGSEVTGDRVALCFGHAVPHRPCRIDEAVGTEPKFVLDREGRARPDLLALGPMTRGCFGEMTGAPDIAAHVEAQAERLFSSHAEGTDRQ